MSDLKITVSKVSNSILVLTPSENFWHPFQGTFARTESSQHSSLLSLFAETAIDHISINQSEFRVKLTEGSDWKEVAKRLAQSIRQLQSGGHQWGEKQPKTDVVHDDQALDAIQTVIDDQIKPVLAQHGGSVEIAEFKSNGELYLRFTGGCQGCSQVTMTLKQGVEKILKEKVPAVESVHDATEHTEGDNPYYK
jgi:Fe-S cluster biogenesis protein NfuA